MTNSRSRAAERLQRDFFARVDPLGGLTALFDHLSSVQFFAKNKRGEFVRASEANLLMLGVRSEEEVIGKTDFDFFDADIARRYVEEDRSVMASGKPAVNQVWLVPDSSGVLLWYLCTKVPLMDRRGRCIGVAGTLQDYAKAGAVLGPYEELSAVIRHIERQYASALSVEKLAQLAHLSVSQFIRRFRKVMHTTPQRYVNKVRMNHACRALVQTDKSISAIAMDVGFCDHSYFTRRFTEQLGLTPSHYRQRFGRGD